MLISACINVYGGNSPIDKREILFIDDAFKSKLDWHLSGIHSKEQRIKSLHEYLYTMAGLNIEYEAGATKTAMEVLRTRSGNCVSLANLYVASARYLGLKAKFQKVKVPLDWQKEDNFYILPDHMNVVVKINSSVTATVELVSTDISKDYPDELISDDQAFSEFYSNRGVEHLLKGEFPRAEKWLLAATSTYPKSGVAWSNLGVAYSHQGEYAKAEAVYRRAYKSVKNKKSVLTNFHALYVRNGEQKKAEEIAQKIQHYRNKNPYVMAEKAEALLSAGDVKGALKLFKKAAKKKKEEAEFYWGVARSYAALGDMKKALKAKKKALALAKTIEATERYNQEL